LIPAAVEKRLVGELDGDAATGAIWKREDNDGCGC